MEVGGLQVLLTCMISNFSTRYSFLTLTHLIWVVLELLAISIIVVFFAIFPLVTGLGVKLGLHWFAGSV